jgi:hypothetical protein
VSKHEQSLVARRRELVERSSLQRSALALSAEPLVRKTAAFDRLVSSLRRYPLVAAVAVGAVVIVGPRKLFDLGERALALYMLLKKTL